MGTTTKRNQTFVFIYALLIVMVIDDHCGGSINLLCNIFPYNSFYMPMFVFASGYFFKECNFVDAIVKKIKRLFLPYIACNLMGVCIALICDFFFKTNWFAGFTFDNILGSLLISPTITAINRPIWFALMLFYVSLSYIFIRIIVKPGIIKDSVLTVCLIVLGFVVLRFCVAHYDFSDTEVMLVRNEFYLQFYHLGYMFNRYWEKHLIKINGLYVIGLSVLINVILIMIWGSEITFVSTSHMKEFHHVFLPLATSVTGILFYYEIMSYLAKRIGENAITNLLGNNTFIIMNVHLLYINIPNFYIYSRFLNGVSKYSDFPVDMFKEDVWVKYSTKSAFIAFWISLTLSVLTVVIYRRAEKFVVSKIGKLKAGT